MDIITLTAFSVGIPFVVGLLCVKRLPWELTPFVMLCGVWFMAEGYSYILRARGISNAHVSYFITPLEIFFFATYFFRQNPPTKFFNDTIGWLVAAGGVIVVCIDYIAFKGSMNTMSLAIEFAFVTCLCIYTFFNTSRYTALNLTVLFYLLSSFPYFFAYEWLRVNYLSHLMLLGGVYAYTHSACYIIMAVLIWKYSSSLSARSSYQR